MRTNNFVELVGVEHGFVEVSKTFSVNHMGASLRSMKSLTEKVVLCAHERRILLVVRAVEVVSTNVLVTLFTADLTIQSDIADDLTDFKFFFVFKVREGLPSSRFHVFT